MKKVLYPRGQFLIIFYQEIKHAIVHEIKKTLTFLNFKQGSFFFTCNNLSYEEIDVWQN